MYLGIQSSSDLAIVIAFVQVPAALWNVRVSLLPKRYLCVTLRIRWPSFRTSVLHCRRDCQQQCEISNSDGGLQGLQPSHSGAFMWSSSLLATTPAPGLFALQSPSILPIQIFGRCNARFPSTFLAQDFGGQILLLSHLFGVTLSLPPVD